MTFSHYLNGLWQDFYLKRPVLIGDVVVRWSSTYSMMGRVLGSIEEYNAACEMMEMSELQLSSELEIQNLQDHHVFLRPFYVLTVILANSK